MTIEKSYNPTETEAKWGEKWEKSGAFACDVKSNKAPYCIMIPPPNVTGSLHMGHGLTFTLQDTLIRYNRMKGSDTLWQPGTDHAGIATQMVVERELAKQGLNRRDMGREKFLEKVWEWKAQSGGTIVKQLHRLGASADWARERFTMDDGLCKAVTKVFVQLYREGLIYKDTRLVNWDPKMLTSVSDLEVEMREVKGHMWHFKYPIEGSADEFVIVATTRPETMLGDTAVAIHPENPTLKHLIGKFAVLPIADRRIPIIADTYADPEKGTGAVKITPAHDFNDYEVGRRHKLPMINIFDQFANLNDKVPEKYRGIERFKAREMIVAEMEALGLLDKIEAHVHTVPHGDRSGVPIEPWLSEQWYCDAKTLAQPAIKAVEEGRTKFVPEQWTNTYNAWMRDIQPWCISRQLWWGHQIPAWYGPDGKYFVAETEEEAEAEAAKYYGQAVGLRRDDDVLDTWFSSALWPFTTLGWPEKTPELQRYYPTDVLVTGFDIIFFWVARMMMMGLHFMGDVPFRTVYMHALVRDEKGQKMSKTKGNVIDPLDMIEKYGCDALRFTLANMSTPGRDIRLAPARIEGNRNFATKLWNAARYCQMNECLWKADFDPASVKHTVNKWIVGATKQAVDRVAAHLDAFRFDLTTTAAYEFVWNEFCDWYLEFTKPILTGSDEAAKAETRATTAWVLAQIMTMLHPFMPYITEELSEQIKGDGDMLITTSWPEYPESLIKTEAAAEMKWVVDLISSIRTIRAELNVPAGAKVQLLVKDANGTTQKRLSIHGAIVEKMARLSGIAATAETPKGSAQAVVDEATYILPLADVINLADESARLKKECEKWAGEIKKISAKLANESFVSRAPVEVVEEQRARKSEAEAMVQRLEAARKSLAG
jgi:valyl-tRNA synthetase